MVELNLEHVLILAVAVFLLYHFVGRCNCFNGFSVGGQCIIYREDSCENKFTIIYTKTWNHYFTKIT